MKGKRKKHLSLAAILKHFKKTKEQCELRRTLEVVAGNSTYRLEVLYCFSNPRSRWSVEVSSRQSGGAWEHIEDFPAVEEQHKESAIRSALAFVEERN